MERVRGVGFYPLGTPNILESWPMQTLAAMVVVTVARFVNWLVQNHNIGLQRLVLLDLVCAHM